MRKVYFVALILFFQGSLAFAQTVIYPFGSTWKYQDNGTDQGTAWRDVGFDDTSWSSGPGQLGFGDGDEATVLSNGQIGYYFRKSINIPDVSIFQSFIFEMYRDDGVVIYVNGIEAFRNNMPTGTISYNTLASKNIQGSVENSIVTASVATSLFVSGNNTIAVEVHQNSVSSSDLSWEMKLTGVPLGLAFITRGPYLQKATSNSMLIRWYTEVPVDSKVSYGTAPGNLSQHVYVTGTRSSHSVQLTGLTPATKYYYSIETSAGVIQSGANNYFLTLPLPNTEGKYTFWVLGDMGNISTRQIEVRNQYNAYMGNNITNGWLLLGDNAYDHGTVQEYTTNFFEIYQSDIMRKAPLWPTTGNNDYDDNLSRRIDLNIPYFDFFDLPTNGEAGGVPSGSEAYYSFDYGNIHFIGLDSYMIENGTYPLSNLSGPQAQWLVSDLSANTKKWTVVYFHHPPYTMGSHNSDTEMELVDIRQNIVPILEQYNVDLVLNGHSHNYERSKLMKGHFGLEATFDPLVHDLSQSSGKYDGTTNSCVYIKNSPGGTVYTIAGSGGQTDPVQPGFPHNAMYYGNETIGGSLILEIEENRLDLKWLAEDGIIRDNFTVMKNVNTVSNINVNAGVSVALTASWVGQYNWSHSGETSRSVSITPISSGIYTVTDPYLCITDTYNVNVTNTISITPLGITEICAGAGINVSYTKAGVFSIGNIFTLQLSNATGSFASPVNIGTLSSTSSGTINGTIPVGTPAGNNYQVRIISSNPSVTSSVSTDFKVNALPALPSVSNIGYCQNATATVLTATALSGHTLQWYGTNATGGTASTTPPIPVTNAVGATTYYVSQKNNTTGCEGARAGIIVTINSLPVLPTVSNIAYCQNATATSLTATALSGHTLQWYGTNATGGTANTTPPIPVTNAVGATTYYVSQKNNTTGCEGARAGIIVTVNALPVLPVVSNIAYCRNETATALTSTALSGHTLQWYGTYATGGTASTTAPTPLTNAVGTTTYYVSQKNNTTGCEGARAGIIVTVNSIPALPTVSNIAYCQNATATALTATALSGHTLQWYGTSATGGTASTIAPTPSTNMVGVTTYYVSQQNNTTGCEGARAGIIVTVNSLPTTPTVSDIYYCQNASATALSAVALSGHTLQWYGTNATGGAPSTIAPTPSTVSLGDTDYYVSQRKNITGCEGARATITVYISAPPASPVVNNVTYCQHATAVALTATALSGHILLWYGTNATGGTSSMMAPTPSTSMPGTTDYYVSQKNNGTGCNGESERAKISVTVVSLPSPPTVTNLKYCQNETAVSLTATASDNHILLWYGTNATGGTASTIAPIPSTTTPGTTDYYVSQKSTISGCDGESVRSNIKVTVNSSPATPIVSDVSYCQNANATPLTATALSGYTLQWYGTNAVGGTASTTAPTPSTNIAGSSTYYVSQKNNATECEGARASIVVSIKSTPKPIITATGIGTGNVLLTSSASSGNQWFTNGNVIPGATSQSYSVLVNGVYQVKVLVDGCVSELSESITVVVTDIVDPEQPIRMNLYPVPADKAVSIQLTGVKDDEISDMIIFDNAGRQVEKRKIRGKEITLIIEEYTAGNYFIRISNKSFFLSSRFVKS